MEKVQRDRLACPICLEIPTAEIYQCKNGHHVCLSCSNRIKSCPQCKVPFGVEKIRVRALEDLIGSMQIACAHKEGGCKTIVMRKDLQAHEKSCEFRPFNVCAHFGIKCDYANSNPRNIFEHLAEAHYSKCTLRKNTSGTLNADKSLSYMKQDVTRGLRRLIQLNTAEGAVANYLILWEVDKLYITISCMYFGESIKDVSPFLFTMEMHAPEKGAKCTWTERPTLFRKADSGIYCPFCVPVDFLLEDWSCNDEKQKLLLNYTFSQS